MFLNLVTSAKSLLPRMVQIHGFWGSGCGHLWGLLVGLAQWRKGHISLLGAPLASSGVTDLSLNPSSVQGMVLAGAAYSPISAS